MKIRTIRPLKVILLGVFACVFTYAGAQYYPSGSDTLNFTSVVFEFPWIDGAASYEVQVENSEGIGNVFASSEANKVPINGLRFDQEYRWKVRGITSIGEKMPWSDPITFRVGTSKFVDGRWFQYEGRKMDRIKATKGLIFFDYGRVGVNRAGKPIWYIPDLDSLQETTQVRDVKMTTSGTFTALIGWTALEFTRDGKVIWQAPDDGQVNGETREHYHHEFTKLPNGNYLVLGQDHVKRRIPETNDSVDVEFGTVIEYDKLGNVVWFWNSNDYFTDADLFSRKRGGGYDVRTHMNACTVYEDQLFVGFRDISRIVVIDKKTKEVTESYGGYGAFSEPHAATGFFRRQHDALRLSDGNLAVFNNDSILDPEVVSSVVVFTQTREGKSYKLMDFKMDFDDLTDGKSVKTGNLNELENGNLLVNLGSINRCIELSRSGEVVWSMFIERYDDKAHDWVPFPQYRASHAFDLYPNVFTSKLTANSLKKRKREIAARVYNVGSEDDTYIVSLVKNGRIKATQTAQISAKGNGNVSFKLKGKSDYNILVKSVNLQESDEIAVPGFK